MFRYTLSLAAIIGITAVAAAQTETNDETLSDRTPQENVQSAALQERSPGAIIRAAIARHSGLINDRVRNRGADAAEEAAANADSGGSTSSSSSTDAGLGDLLSSLTGGALSADTINAFTGLLGSDGISSLLSGGVSTLLGSGSTTTASAGSSTNGTSSTTSTSGATPTAAQQSSLEQLLALRDQFAGGSQSKAIQASGDANAGRAPVSQSAKTAQRSQTNGGDDDEEPSFRVRLYNSWLSTIFTAVTAGFRTRDFIDSLKDALRPALGLPAPTTQPTTRPSGGSQV